VRLTRDHRWIRRGASVRAALSIAELAAYWLKKGDPFESAFSKAARLALPTRIELERDAEGEDDLQSRLKTLLQDLVQKALDGADPSSKKKS
jgi:hypothetical protein